MKLTHTAFRLLPATVALVAISLLGGTPASAQCYGGPSYAGASVYSHHPAYDHAWGGGYLDYGYTYPSYPSYHGHAVYHHGYRPYYRSYRYRDYGRGYPSYYGGATGYWGRGYGYGGGGCY